MYLLTIIIIIATTQGVCHCVTQFVGGAVKIGSGLLLHQHLVTFECQHLTCKDAWC